MLRSRSFPCNPIDTKKFRLTLLLTAKRERHRSFHCGNVKSNKCHLNKNIVHKTRTKLNMFCPLPKKRFKKKRNFQRLWIAMQYILKPDIWLRIEFHMTCKYYTFKIIFIQVSIFFFVGNALMERKGFLHATNLHGSWAPRIDTTKQFGYGSWVANWICRIVTVLISCTGTPSLVLFYTERTQPQTIRNTLVSSWWDYTKVWFENEIFLSCKHYISYLRTNK